MSTRCEFLRDIRRQEHQSCARGTPGEAATALARLRYFDQLEAALASGKVL